MGVEEHLPLCRHLRQDLDKIYRSMTAPLGLCRGATEVAEGSDVEDGWWWGSGEPAT